MWWNCPTVKWTQTPRLLPRSMEMSLVPEFRGVSRWISISRNCCQTQAFERFSFMDTHPFGRPLPREGQTFRQSSQAWCCAEMYNRAVSLPERKDRRNGVFRNDRKKSGTTVLWKSTLFFLLKQMNTFAAFRWDSNQTNKNGRINLSYCYWATGQTHGSIALEMTFALWFVSFLWTALYIRKSPAL